jgi:uncharacterized protein
LNAKATFPTEHATRHLASLCKHFAQKVPASCDDRSGKVEFPFGCCEMVADSQELTLTASSPDKAHLDQVTDIITRHLERFAFRENPDLTWCPVADLNPKT